jgi:rSAM/selenodomain-associated transferase 1
LKAPAIAIFARAPAQRKTKTRLIPLLGAEGAAAFQGALISDVIRKVDLLSGDVRRYLFLAGQNSHGCSLPSDYTLMRQRGADLGERLTSGFRLLLRRHPEAVVIGTDSPTLPLRLLNAAIRELDFCDGVLGPCPDGGYYLVGLRRLEAHQIQSVFRDIRWGSAFAFRDTLRNLLRNKLSCSILEPWGDVDRPRDFHRLKRELAARHAARRLAPATWRFVQEHSTLLARSSAARF